MRHCHGPSGSGIGCSGGLSLRTCPSCWEQTSQFFRKPSTSPSRRGHQNRSRRRRFVRPNPSGDPRARWSVRANAAPPAPPACHRGTRVSRGSTARAEHRKNQLPLDRHPGGGPACCSPPLAFQRRRNATCQCQMCINSSCSESAISNLRAAIVTNVR